MSLPFDNFPGKTDLSVLADENFDFDLENKRSKSLEHKDRFTSYEISRKTEIIEEIES